MDDEDYVTSDDDDDGRGRSVEIGIRLLGGAKTVSFGISHVYWA